MKSKDLKRTGLVIQLLGLVVLVLGLRGFLIFQGTFLYFPALIVAVGVFALCLFKGGSMHKKGKDLEKQGRS